MSHFSKGKLLRSPHLFRLAFTQCDLTGRNTVLGQLLKAVVAWLSISLSDAEHQLRSTLFGRFLVTLVRTCYCQLGCFKSWTGSLLKNQKNVSVLLPARMQATRWELSTVPMGLSCCCYYYFAVYLMNVADEGRVEESEGWVWSTEYSADWWPPSSLPVVRRRLIQHTSPLPSTTVQLLRSRCKPVLLWSTGKDVLFRACFY